MSNAPHIIDPYENVKIHPACDLFPAMTEKEFDDLIDDIAQHGVRVPVLMHKGYIVDGRHRWRAALQTGHRVPVEEWKEPTPGASLVEHVVALNLHRRSLNASQRAMVAAEMLPLLEQEAEARKKKLSGTRSNPGKKKEAEQVEERIPQPARASQSRDIAAKATGANPRYVQDVKTIKKEAPDLAEQVAKGSLTIPKAKTQLKQRKQAAAEPIQPTCKLGHPINSPIAVEVFADKRLDELTRAITTAKSLAKDIKNTPLGRYLEDRVYDDLDYAQKLVKHAKPYTNCMRCKHDTTRKGCTCCGSGGWITKPMFDNEPADLRNLFTPKEKNCA